MLVQPQKKKDGTLSKRAKVKGHVSGNPFIDGIDFLGKRLVQQKRLDEKVWKNIEGTVGNKRLCSAFL